MASLHGRLGASLPESSDGAFSSSSQYPTKTKREMTDLLYHYAGKKMKHASTPSSKVAAFLDWRWGFRLFPCRLRPIVFSNTNTSRLNQTALSNTGAVSRATLCRLDSSRKRTDVGRAATVTCDGQDWKNYKVFGLCGAASLQLVFAIAKSSASRSICMPRFAIARAGSIIRARPRAPASLAVVAAVIDLATDSWTVHIHEDTRPKAQGTDVHCTRLVVCAEVRVRRWFKWRARGSTSHEHRWFMTVDLGRRRIGVSRQSACVSWRKTERHCVRSVLSFSCSDPPVLRCVSFTCWRSWRWPRATMPADEAAALAALFDKYEKVRFDSKHCALATCSKSVHFRPNKLPDFMYLSSLIAACNLWLTMQVALINKSSLGVTGMSFLFSLLQGLAAVCLNPVKNNTDSVLCAIIVSP